MPVLKVLKLITGDEIIGVVEDGRDQEPLDGELSLASLLFVSSPMKIIANYDQENRTHSIFLSDYVPAIGDHVFPISKHNVVVIGNPTAALEEHYLELVVMESNEQQNESEEDKKTKEYNKILKKHRFSDDDLQ